MIPAKKKLLGADGRIHCPHCEGTVGKQTYWRHKHLYYNYSTDQWQMGLERISDSEEELESTQSCPMDSEPSCLELHDHPEDDSGSSLQSTSVSLQLYSYIL